MQEKGKHFREQGFFHKNQGVKFLKRIREIMLKIKPENRQRGTFFDASYQLCYMHLASRLGGSETFLGFQLVETQFVETFSAIYCNFLRILIIYRKIQFFIIFIILKFVFTIFILNFG